MGDGASPRREEPAGHHLVLNRSRADLYEEVAGLFAGRPDIRVVVDRRQAARMQPGRARARLISRPFRRRAS